MAKKPDAKKKVVKPHIPAFTPEQEKILNRGLQLTWNNIASDILQSIEENEHRSYMNRDEVLEVVCDAGYCADVDAEAGKLLDELFDAVGPKINMAYKYLEKFFPYTRYS